MLRRETLVPVSSAGRRAAALGIVFSAALALGGCGQKGPLYLPREPVPNTTPATAPETVTPDAATPEPVTPESVTPAPATPTSAPDKADQRSEGTPHAA